MRAFVITGPRQSEVREVEPPQPLADQVVIDIERVGLCGTDIEFFTGEMPYLQQKLAAYPMRIGHEWCGRVASVGAEVDPTWIGRLVTGDTMLGCRRCLLCQSGRGYLCKYRYEVGIRGGWPGALAEQLAVPVASLHVLPNDLDPTIGAMVEPGGNALRAVQATNLQPGQALLIIGSGTIGLAAAQFAVSQGIETHLLGIDPVTLAFARTLGVAGAWTEAELPDRSFEAVIDCSTARTAPAHAADIVEPGGRLVYIGLSGEPSLIDTRSLVLNDITAIGVLSASPALAETIESYASGQVDPRPLVAATMDLAGAAGVLAGERPAGARPGPKVHFDPRLP